MNVDDMNEIGVYAIYDHRQQTYDTPFFASNEIMARRRFSIMIEENEKGPLQLWPTDFELIQLGFVNMKIGNITQEHGPVMRASDYVTSKQAREN